jgi:hypothetical protein
MLLDRSLATYGALRKSNFTYLIGFVGPDDNLYLAVLWTAVTRRGAGGSHQKRAAFDMIRTY